jgi:heat shock protein HspQ
MHVAVLGKRHASNQWLKAVARISINLNSGDRFGRIEFSRALIHIAAMGPIKSAKFAIGQVVRHRVFPFRGVIFDVDPEFNNTEEWYQAIPQAVRPRKDQPFYHLLAENSQSQYIAYVSEQNLLDDSDGEPPQHPQISEFFDRLPDGRFEPKGRASH